MRQHLYCPATVFLLSVSDSAIVSKGVVFAITMMNRYWSLPNRLASTFAPGLFATPQQQQCRFMSKYLSRSATKRLPLNTKRAGKGYKKGKGATNEGRLTSKGRFIVNPAKRLRLMVPEGLETFKLKPYIARTVPKWAPEDRHSNTPAPVA